MLDDGNLFEDERQNAPKAKPPDFKGDGVAVWINKDKNGKTYLNIKLFNQFTVPAWKYEKREAV